MAGKVKPKDPPPKGAPLWIVTFTDMSSLLLTFFILILTFSSTEEIRQNKTEGSLVGAFGTNPSLKPKRDISPTLSTDMRDKDRDGVLKRHLRRDQVDEVKKAIQRRDLFNVEIDDVSQGTRLRISPSGGDEIFELIEPELTSEAITLLQETGKLIRSMPYRIVIETHVDDRTWSIQRGMNAERWTLERGLAAAEVLEGMGIPPERISVSPKGDFVPLEKNSDGPQQRYRNRRIEILLLPDLIDPLYRKFAMKDGANG